MNVNRKPDDVRWTCLETPLEGNLRILAGARYQTPLMDSSIAAAVVATGRSDGGRVVLLLDDDDVG